MFPFQPGTCLRHHSGHAYAFCGVGQHPAGLCAVLRHVLTNEWLLVPVADVEKPFERGDGQLVPSFWPDHADPHNPPTPEE